MRYDAGGRQHAEHAVSGAVARRLRRQGGSRRARADDLGPHELGFGGLGLVDLRHHGVRGFSHIGPRRHRMGGDGRSRLIGAGGSKLHRAGLDLNGPDPHRLHRLGGAGDRGKLLGLDHAAGERGGLRLGLRLQAWAARVARRRPRPPSARVLRA